DGGGLYMVTDGEWKYLYYAQGSKEQLFNLLEDPHEMHDLSDSELVETKAQIDMHRQLLTAKFTEHDIVDEHGRIQLNKIEYNPENTQELRVSNPFAWRGPMRYGGHW